MMWMRYLKFGIRWLCENYPLLSGALPRDRFHTPASSLLSFLSYLFRVLYKFFAVSLRTHSGIIVLGCPLCVSLLLQFSPPAHENCISDYLTIFIQLLSLKVLEWILSHKWFFQMWQRDGLECSQVLHGHTGSVLCLQYDDNVIVSGSSDATVRYGAKQTVEFPNRYIFSS